jgi:hypothetical protein
MTTQTPESGAPASPTTRRRSPASVLIDGAEFLLPRRLW